MGRSEGTDEDCKAKREQASIEGEPAFPWISISGRHCRVSRDQYTGLLSERWMGKEPAPSGRDVLEETSSAKMQGRSRTTATRQRPLETGRPSLPLSRERELAIVPGASVPGAEQGSFSETLAGPTGNPVLVGVLCQSFSHNAQTMLW